MALPPVLASAFAELRLDSTPPTILPSRALRRCRALKRSSRQKAAEAEVIAQTPTEIDVHIFKSESEGDLYGLTLERSGDNLPAEKGPWTYFRDIPIVEGEFVSRFGVEDMDFEEKTLSAFRSIGFYLTKARIPPPKRAVTQRRARKLK
jgi:hypothetical protein